MNEDFDYLLNAPVTEEEKTYIDVLETPEEEQDTVPVSIAAPEASEEDLDKLLLAVQQQGWLRLVLAARAGALRRITRTPALPRPRCRRPGRAQR